MFNRIIKIGKGVFVKKDTQENTPNCCKTCENSFTHNGLMRCMNCTRMRKSIIIQPTGYCDMFKRKVDS